MRSHVQTHQIDPPLFFLFHQREHLFRLRQTYRIFLRAFEKTSCGGHVVSFQGDGGKIEQSERLLGIFRQRAIEQFQRAGIAVGIEGENAGAERSGSKGVGRPILVGRSG